MSEGNGFKKEEILEFTKALGLGFYRVTEAGQLVECDSRAREIFDIPQEESDLSRYSIKNLYMVPAERELRIKKLMEDKSKPISGSLIMQIKGKRKLLFDICRYDESYPDKGIFVGLIAEIENSTIFPKMFDTFPLGLYELDNEGNVARVNTKLTEILKYNILGKPFKDICEDEKELDEFNQEILGKGYANKILRLKDAKNKIIEVECFSQNVNNYEKPRWGMVTDVTTRERYYRALDTMPTAFFYIEKECIKDCNDHFVHIQGFENKEAALGVHTKQLFADEEERKKYLQNLRKADERGEALHNYEFQAKRINDGEIITVSVDSRLVKDSTGNVIGREGTARDVTERVKLRKRVKETQERLEKTTADINRLIHTFLHPVVKFAGNSELMSQVADNLRQSFQLETSTIYEPMELAEELMAKLIELKDNIPDIYEDISFAEEKETGDKLSPLTAKRLKEKLEEIIYIFDYSIKTEESNILLGGIIRDTALRVLEELNRASTYSSHSQIKSLIKEDFIELLQDILFNYLIRGSSILMGETKVMKREVEALRKYIGMKKPRQYPFANCDIREILEGNIEQFKPVLLEANIEIDYKSSGNLRADISPNDIDRVICNLFYNAKKYSYKGKKRFLKIRARELQPENMVEFFIQSFGIPIKEKEIDSGSIWKFGYRGELVYKTDRDGTGVGLADAKDTIEAHGGEIFLTSKPVIDDGQPHEYKVPYLTTVRIKLPKTRNI